jgi:UDP-GlcNAc:undecaprenyl-phosphate GlcNAc-1-phosphate transferase
MIPEYAIYGYTFVVTFLLSLFGTFGMRRFAVRLGVLDNPGHRKVHQQPVPLLGGVGIVGAFYIFALAHIIAIFLFWGWH